ncbi:3-hydroxyacyl-CoA dehydrogenase [Thiolinea disciformis]|uniref:3-hydroxyacyl-CoA dehydrogenase n=1 Tax=Thiolinea disciformis TaxID=125614 RepID=UPI00037EEB5F|nr:3-hydroxyacyl-CoA dehydrogenase [Thiolinea disciformis]
MKFAGNTFIVTGGASGLGEASVRALHAAQANVVIADLNVERGHALVAELGEHVTFQKTNVADEADAQTTIDTALQNFGAIHGLVNAAGIGTAARVVGKNGPQALADFSRVIQVNLLGSFNMLRLAAAAMCKNAPQTDGERGVIINTASIAAYDGQIGQAAYAASKGGIVAMTLPIARELAGQGIRVVTIAPGLFLTPMMLGLPEDVQQSLGASVPFPTRLGKPEEFAKLVLSIVDNPMLNGETIRLDGALRMAAR